MAVVYADQQPWMEVEVVTGGVPRVRITLVGIGASSRFLTLSRVCEGEEQIVPGWHDREVVDATTDVDWFAPVDRETAYNITEHGEVISTAFITLPSGGTAWISDPLQPDLAMPVKVGGFYDSSMLNTTYEGLREIQRTAPSNIVYPVGAKYGIGMGGRRRAASGVSLTMFTKDDEVANRFENLIDGPPILVFRPMPGMPLPPVAYILADVSEAFNRNPSETLTNWAVTGDLVAAVTQVAMTGLVTYQQVEDLLAGYSYAEVQTFAAATIYLDWQKNPLIVGEL